MSFSSIESTKNTIKTSNNLFEAESLAAIEAISSLQPTLSFNSKSNVKTANAISIFNPITADNFSNYGKPNAIVRPVIRKTEISDDMTAPQSNDTIIPISSQVTVFKQDNPIQIKRRDIDSFNRKFNVKLKQLPKDKKNSSKNGSNSGLLDQAQVRPRFFTTVPTGIFLQPPKEITIAQKRYQPRPYAYFSIPKIFAQKINKGNKENPITEIHTIEAATTIGRPFNRREPHQQHSQNIMYDRRVVRGSNYSHNNMQTGDYDATTKIAEAERRLFLRKRYSDRKKRNIIGTPPPVKGRRHEIIQTEQYMERLFVKPNDYSVECQTDLFLYEVPEPIFVSSKNGVDVATEIDDDNLYDFNTEIEPIVDALVAFAMEQAMHEFMDEEELFELYEQKQQYLILRNAQTEEMNNSDNYSKDVNSSAGSLNANITKLLPNVLMKVNQEIQMKNIQKIDEKFSVWLANVIVSEIVESLENRMDDHIPHTTTMNCQ